MTSHRPNVIVSFTDQQRWDTLGAAGNPLGLTPNLDLMCRQGTMFEVACTTNPSARRPGAGPGPGSVPLTGAVAVVLPTYEAAGSDAGSRSTSISSPSIPRALAIATWSM